MSLAKQLSGLSLGRSQLQVSLNNNINQVRFATKRAAGSKTNKNDSAGRRLGPKAYEGHFVKTGQIIMRQRGTKIHPGENVDIGKDHTIFAKEPGFVRFYYDPFHPLRKFVGVALKKELSLPTPHFEPRIRRFGYEEILDPAEAKREEEHMSRVEYLQQPELKETKRRRKEKIAESLAKYGSALNEFNLGLSEDESKLAQERLLSIAQLVRVGQSVEEAGIQASYNHLYDLKLSLQRSDITPEEHDTSRQKYLDFVSSFDKKITLDADLNACKYISPEDKIKQQQEIQSQLKNYFNKLITKEDKAKITELIKTPGVFTKSEQHDLFDTYLPKVLPDSIPGATVEIKDAKKAPKGVIIRKIFNEETKTVDLVGKPKEAFLA